ncbi:MAG: hypothetical protein GF383_04010 [Candidatus Lokiarchaeota archaeon]|nr:hypothetical protein [Candidatus Lokiarchaeota archaeon]MBD3338890.1 hypothetical protein [Candidatus Lokiarchaeota archaeon]
MSTNSKNDYENPSGIYSKNEISLEQAIDSLKSHPEIAKVGSILTFTGIVRATSLTGKKVSGMKIDAYEEIANQKISSICQELKASEGIIEVIIIHFKGEFEISDDLVYVIVGSSHREEGFKTLREAVEAYKKQLTVWKKEIYEDGNSEWID